ncbi:asparagine-linked glycosylation protein [Mycoemilia scoparia]|uniref:GDP-Man:Man(3)GlcNAc(2)-PP-Dol alpha-1,2-mannosyltransferase n=1 Tax=Mycoemilia scoparia TaxID=417184 RepID=A0A9W8A7K6_9FUNG|nr:asparagine-linked glycosylation protein [Mycoemilia scoparia]
MYVLGTDVYQQKRRELLLQKVKPDTDNHEPVIVGFFHPYASAGGGGERVLWTAIEGIQQKHPHIVSVVYTGDDGLDKQGIIEKVENGFGIKINPDTIEFIFLKKRSWTNHKYPYLTILLQSIGSIILVTEALIKCLPDIFVDTLGYGFTYPYIYYLSHMTPIVSYTHYPLISSDMIKNVQAREGTFNNSTDIAQSSTLSKSKLYYYKVLKFLYGWSGWHASTVMTNSSWTQGHIESMFGKSPMIKIVYPPCDTNALGKFELQPRNPWLVSLAQFRPEKGHALQVQSFAKFLEQNREYKKPKATGPALKNTVNTPEDIDSKDGYPHLIIIGGARNIEDEARAESLRQLSIRLGVENQIHVITNATFSQIKSWLSVSLIGLHTMTDEHFGIGIVEFMSAGLIPIAHDSAGPKMDIVVPAHLVKPSTEGKYSDFDEANIVGFLANSSEDYASTFSHVLKMPKEQQKSVQQNARKKALTSFSTESFINAFMKRFDPVLVWLDNQRSPE